MLRGSVTFLYNSFRFFKNETYGIHQKKETLDSFEKIKLGLFE